MREWWDDDGWGVVDSPETPGGCWTHYSHIATARYRSLLPGQQVMLEWETADQDGYGHRAVRVWPADEEPAAPEVDGGGGAYTSSLTLTVDEPAPGSTRSP